jgi:hypothetical protein
MADFNPQQVRKQTFDKFTLSDVEVLRVINGAAAVEGYGESYRSLSDKSE